MMMVMMLIIIFIGAPMLTPILTLSKVADQQRLAAEQQRLAAGVLTNHKP